MPRQQLIIPIQHTPTELYVTVPLPYDDSARAAVQQRIEELGFMLRSECILPFQQAIAYLPETESELKMANALYAKGFDWHTACHRAREVR